MNILALIFGFFLASGGVFIMIASQNHKIAPYLSFSRIARNLKKLFTQGPDKSGVISANSISYWAESDHYHGYYPSGNGWVIGSAARIQVCPDLVARLRYIDYWSNSRLLDSNRFCLRTNDAEDIVEYISRGRRWCMDFNDDSFHSSDGYTINCQVSTHWYVPLSIEQDQEFNCLFDDLGLLLSTLRDAVSGTLRKDLRGREYRQAMYDIPKILDSLNKEWKTSPHFNKYRNLVHIEFTGLMLKPREEAERKFLDRLERGRAKINEQVDEIRKHIDHTSVDFQDRWHEIMVNRSEAIDELMSQLPEALKSQSNSIKDMVIREQMPDDAINQARGVFDSGLRQLQECSDRLMKVYDQLAEFIRDLDKKIFESLKKPDQQKD